MLGCAFLPAQALKQRVKDLEEQLSGNVPRLDSKAPIE